MVSRQIVRMPKRRIYSRSPDIWRQTRRRTAYYLDRKVNRTIKQNLGNMPGQGWSRVGRLRKRYGRRKRRMTYRQMMRAVKQLQKMVIPQPDISVYNQTTRGISNIGECVWISTVSTPTFHRTNLLTLNGLSEGEHQKFFVKDLQQIQFTSCVEQDQLVDIYVCQFRTDLHEDQFATEYLTDGFTDVYGAGDSTKPHVNIFMNRKFCTKVKIIKSKRMRVQAGKNYKFYLKQAEAFNGSRLDQGGVTEDVSFLRGSKFLLFKCLGTIVQDQTTNTELSYGQSGLNVVWTGDMRVYKSADTKVNVNDANTSNLGTVTTAEFVGDDDMKLETVDN